MRGYLSPFVRFAELLGCPYQRFVSDEWDRSGTIEGLELRRRAGQYNIAMTRLLRDHALFLLLFFAAGVYYVTTLREGHDWGSDFAIYLAQTENVAAGKNQYANSYMATEQSMRTQPAAYPPMTSWLMAPLYAMFGLDYGVLKTELVIFLWLGLACTYLVGLRMGIQPAVAAVAVAILAFSTLTLDIKDSIGSDQVFLLTTALSLLVIHWLYAEGWTERRPVAAAVAIALLVSVSYATRALGLAILMGWGIVELVHARRLRAFAFGTGALTLGCLFLYTKQLYAVPSQYGTQFSMAAGQVIENLLVYVRLPGSLWESAPSALRYPLALAVWVGFVVSFVPRLRKPTICEGFFAMLFLPLLVYKAGNARYAHPICGLMLLYAADGLWKLSQRVSFGRWAAVGLGVVALAAAGWNVRSTPTGPIEEGVMRQDFQETVAFLKRTVDKDGLVVSWSPRLLAYYTGRPSALYSYKGEPQSVAKELGIHGRVYVVHYDAPAARERRPGSLEAYLREHTELKPIWETGKFRVYEFNM
jgi:hypothetical protein